MEKPAEGRLEIVFRLPSTSWKLVANRAGIPGRRQLAERAVVF